MALLFASVAAFGCLTPAQGYSTGAPTEVCEDMLPQHGEPVQTTESPYTLTPNRKSAKGGETITLTLASKDFSKFKGFMVQARDGQSKPVGSFMSLPQSKSGTEFKGKWKVISCPKGPANVSICVRHERNAFGTGNYTENSSGRVKKFLKKCLRKSL